MKTEINTENEYAIKITGSAEIKVTKGTINLFGIELNEGSTLKIENMISGQISPNSIIEIVSDETTIIETTKTPVCKNYQKFMDLLIEQINKDHLTKYLFVGHVDAGKSTMLLSAANRLISKGHKVGILDLDVGQSISKRPAAINLSIVDGLAIDQLKLKHLSSRFVGVVSPYNFEYRIIAATKMLMKQVEDVDVILIDTPGWIQDARGRDFMYSIYEVIEADFIFSFGDDTILRPFIKLLNARQISHLYVGKSIFAESRDWQIRKNNRENAFRDLFENAKKFKITLSNLITEFSQIGSGIPTDLKIADETILWAEAINEYLIIITKGLEFKEIEQLKYELFDNKTKVIQSEQLKGLVVGLMDKKGYLLGYGRINDLERNGSELNLIIESNVPPEQIKGIAFSIIRLDENYRELDRLKFREL